VAERFLTNYDKASEVGKSVSQEDLEAIGQIKESLAAYEAQVEAELQSRLSALDSVLGSVQRRAKSTVGKVLSSGYITSNIVSCLTRSKNIESELRTALDVDLSAELSSIVRGFGQSLRDKENAQWLLCSALVKERLRGRSWELTLDRPDVDGVVNKLEERLVEGKDSTTKAFDPDAETVLLAESVTDKAFNIAATTSGVGGGGLLMLEVFNAGILDFLTFVATVVGVTFSLGFYPSILQDDLEKELVERSTTWKEALREEVGDMMREAATSSVMEMEAAFKGYTDAARAENAKWKEVASRVKESEEKLRGLKKRINDL